MKILRNSFFIISSFFCLHFADCQAINGTFQLEGFGDGLLIVDTNKIKGFYYNERGNSQITTQFIINSEIEKKQNSNKWLNRYKIEIEYPEDSIKSGGELIIDFRSMTVSIMLEEVPAGNLFNINGGKKADFRIKRIERAGIKVGYIKKEVGILSFVIVLNCTKHHCFGIYINNGALKKKNFLRCDLHLY